MNKSLISQFERLGTSIRNLTDILQKEEDQSAELQKIESLNQELIKNITAFRSYCGSNPHLIKNAAISP
ncbi:hypothetical protein TVAG_249550 [Trichomonas vaginalis G3]|uniref:Uncharacterized protein n=1 Tax=Trichomonas vaginalis (strain ATCC PRA-98 / G3) TaxID=412133 RepID=A2DCF8_TRIV3|nr:hypothetical protein TVAGG3_0956960 [Trichomonas vaginalis G3]EAY21895.1 hypothetical protein TVAG_249550 [Trichomonas vaginalis G3]KAI5487629.1 hypothetical protein TVAGG3_0956960 [Trichomonas vaginalis G3]|eukprot:XP_001582881.1 hypothetical protein [Trichomonas vaginalis G3]